MSEFTVDQITGLSADEALGKLQELSISELEQLSYMFTAEIANLKQSAVMIQGVMGAKIEEQAVRKILGDNAQILQPKGIDSTSVVGTPGAGV